MVLEDVNTDFEQAKRWQAEEDAKAAGERATRNATIGPPQEQNSGAARTVASVSAKLITQQPPDHLSVANAIQWRASRIKGIFAHAQYQGYLD